MYNWIEFLMKKGMFNTFIDNILFEISETDKTANIN